MTEKKKKTEEERLQELETKMQQLKAKKQQIQSRVREKERKANARRLIQIGAIFQKYFECETPEEAEKIAKMFAAPVQGKQSLWKIPSSEQPKEKVAID